MLSFHVKFVQTDRRTTVKQYAPDLSMWGHKNCLQKKYVIYPRKHLATLACTTQTLLYSVTRQQKCLQMAIFLWLSVAISL